MRLPAEPPARWGRRRLGAAALLLPGLAACAAAAAPASATAEAAGLRVTLRLADSRVRRFSDLGLEADFTNTRDRPISLETRMLASLPLMLRFRRADPAGEPFGILPPPMPWAPEDHSGLVPLGPDETRRQRWSVPDFDRPTGAYAVQLRYGQPSPDWNGRVETAWLGFRLAP